MVLEYIHSQNNKQRELLLFIHDLMMSYEGVVSKIRYRVPFYYKRSWLCYANPKKKGEVELVFLRANEFDNHTGVLDTKGRKQVASLTIENLEDIPEELSEVIKEALRIDEVVKYKSKRSK